MTDAVSPHGSIALYRYLCKNIVGTEDDVKQIRLMNAVRDHLTSNNCCTVITSGSFGEGLDMRGSDLDIMYINKDFDVYEDANPRFNSIAYFSMERDDVKPGFTQLRLHDTRYQNLVQFSIEQNGKIYFSSTLYKERFLQNKRDTIHGPCISDKHGLIDGAHCLHCKTWVSPAEQWITRSNNSWPSHTIKQRIINHGVLFVPIGVKGSPKEDIEWRLSFSIGEKLLINSFTHTQLVCYALFKILLKDVIGTFSKCEDLLCSYFLKTIIFWISEELPQSIWKPENFIPCFMRCFSRLVYCVEHSVCSHYFIPENNIFENKIEGRAGETLLKNLYTLYSYGWRCILFSNQISNFNVSMWSLPIEPHTSYVNDVEKTLKSKILVSESNAVESGELNELNKKIIQTVSCQQSSIRHIYKFYLSKFYNGHAQYIPLDGTFSSNRYRYKQYKACLSNLVKNIYHDAASGWLMVASLFYKTKQYGKALIVIMYSLSKCTHEKLYHNMTMSDINYQLLKLETFQKKGLVSLLKIMYVDIIRFKTNSMLIPDELQLNGWNEIQAYPSVAYSYFMNFLCHYHLSNFRKCQDSLQTLQLVIDEDYLMTSITLKAEAYTLLGIALDLFGDKESARQAFLKSGSIKLFYCKEDFVDELNLTNT